MDGEQLKMTDVPDDSEKVNYEGIYEISEIILNMVAELNSKLKLAFTRTKEDDTSSKRSFKVTLGVVPDYLYDGVGMKIEGVKEDRPAANAGIIGGDIVIKMGEVEVTNMNSYMKGLNQFEKGQKTTVRVRRGDEEMDFEVEF